MGVGDEKISLRSLRRYSDLGQARNYVCVSVNCECVCLCECV